MLENTITLVTPITQMFMKMHTCIWLKARYIMGISTVGGTND